jgi:GntR family transcriptional regulator, transcriptional repressor for pyruvate dehydrogenase complex
MVTDNIDRGYRQAALHPRHSPPNMTELLLQREGEGTLSDRVYARIVEAILRGDFGAGGKLPTEGDLAARFGVSRPTVREALSRLRSDGVIETRRGSGSHVVPANAPRGGASPAISSLGDVERYYAFRSCVEAGAAAGAAEFRDADDLERIRADFDALTRAMESGQPGTEEDVRFHLAIARASHNPFFVSTIETSVAPIRQFMELARSVTDKKTMERVRRVQAEHQAIVDAIAKRSPADAAEAVRIHVLNAKRRIFEGTRLP